MIPGIFEAMGSDAPRSAVPSACVPRVFTSSPLRFSASLEANNNLGLTFVNLECIREAEASLTRALELNPGLFEVNSALAFFYLNERQNREALERLRTPRHLRPDNGRALALLDQQYLQGCYPDEAIQAMRESIQLNAENPEL